MLGVLHTWLVSLVREAYTLPFGGDTYACEHSARAAKLAVGCSLSLVDAVFSSITCGMAVIRPPGHHATTNVASGFCLFNNAAVAARYAQQRHGAQRVAIIDWDVHHGNGTSEIFSEDCNCLVHCLSR